MIRKTAVVSSIVVGWSMFVCAAAPDDQSPPGAQPSSKAAPAAASKDPQAPQSEAPAPKKRELGSWWEKNSLEYTPGVNQWLFHAAGTFSYMNAAGNTSGSTLDTSGDAEIRKRRFTSRSFVQLTRRNMVYGFGGGSVDYIERTMREQLDFDLTSHLKVVGGIEDYRNTMIFMDKRRNLYAGLGATVWRTPKHVVTLTMGLGHADFVFDRARMLQINPGSVGVDTSPGSGGHLGLQTWQWKPSRRFIFSQDSGYTRYFNSDLGYRWTFNMNGNVPINRRLSFNVTYRFKVEDNTIIQALRVKTQDRTFVIGIRLST